MSRQWAEPGGLKTLAEDLRLASDNLIWFAEVWDRLDESQRRAVQGLSSRAVRLIADLCLSWEKHHLPEPDQVGFPGV